MDILMYIPKDTRTDEQRALDSAAYAAEKEAENLRRLDGATEEICCASVVSIFASSTTAI